MVKRLPVTCAQSTPVREALVSMRTHQVGSILVTDRLEHPVGVFTLRDLRDRVVLAAYSIDEPIGGVMSPRPFCLPLDAPALDAALAMARRSIRHVVLTDESGRAAGVVSERDLFALQRSGLSRIAAALRGAERLEDLQAIAADIRGLAHNLMTQGVGADRLTRLISELNDQLTQRIIHLALAPLDLDGVRWCWLALGSEGRFEQTLFTDQDNGLLFTAPPEMNVEAVRALLLPAARQVNDWLDACGFPLCKGEIMASNPKWCLSLEEWKATFGDWLFRGDAPVLLNASIFFDFRPLAGEADLADDLRQWLHQKLKYNRLFLKLMTLNALARRPPLGLVRDFVLENEGEYPHTLDLKINGAALFVDAARIFALAAGLAVTSTVARLSQAATAWKLSREELQGWVDAFHYLQQLRLRLHQDLLGRGQPMHNQLDPDQLTVLDRHTLKEAFRQAKRLQTKLESYFQF
jgi:CBS domain-containing protein